MRAVLFVSAIASPGLALGVSLAGRLRSRGAAIATDASTAATRIINGSVVHSPSVTYPFFALPTEDVDSDQWLGCGASIISPTFALTSAHCFGGGSEPCSHGKKVAVWVGDVQLESFFVRPKDGDSPRHFRAEAEVICSKEFDGKCSHGNDVTLLKLKTKVPSWVKPVPLNLLGNGNDAPGSVVRSMGFGVTESASDAKTIGDVAMALRDVSIHVLDDDMENCQRMYENGWGCSDSASEGKAINIGHQLCAGAESKQTERDTCSGDSGSPMIDSSGVQVGIVSYGGGPNGASGAGRECGDRDFPGIYARVSAFADFLREHVHDLPEHSQHESHA